VGVNKNQTNNQELAVRTARCLGSTRSGLHPPPLPAGGPGRHPPGLALGPSFASRLWRYDIVDPQRRWPEVPETQRHALEKEEKRPRVPTKNETAQIEQRKLSPIPQARAPGHARPRASSGPVRGQRNRLGQVASAPPAPRGEQQTGRLRVTRTRCRGSLVVVQNGASRRVSVTAALAPGVARRGPGSRRKWPENRQENTIATKQQWR
jgi:hypothetical protein